jgi:HJR/Mrr/RecB family endonuclease
MRILIIDNEIRSMETHIYFLKRQLDNCTVDCERDNSTALEFIRNSEPYDVIVQDMSHLPDLVDVDAAAGGLKTGLLFYNSYLRLECPTTPVLFFSNNSFASTAVSNIGFPFCTYLDKGAVLPSKFSEVISAIVAKTLELLYEHIGEEPKQDQYLTVIADIHTEIKKYLSRHPERLYDLSPRRFEELVAGILQDMGLDVELTKATRDGGVDIYAYFHHEVSSFIILVECKRWAPDNPVGVDIIQRLYCVQQTQQANKSLIVTTSYFTGPAKREAALHNNLIDLIDYDSLKQWLKRYSSYA